MNEADELDDVWRDVLRDLAEIGDGAGAPARVRRRVRARARHRRARQSVVVVFAAVGVVVAAGIGGASRGGAPDVPIPAATIVAPPTSDGGIRPAPSTDAFVAALQRRPIVGMIDVGDVDLRTMLATADALLVARLDRVAVSTVGRVMASAIVPCQQGEGVPSGSTCQAGTTMSTLSLRLSPSKVVDLRRTLGIGASTELLIPIGPPGPATDAAARAIIAAAPIGATLALFVNAAPDAAPAGSLQFGGGADGWAIVAPGGKLVPLPFHPASDHPLRYPGIGGVTSLDALLAAAS